VYVICLKNIRKEMFRLIISRARDATRYFVFVAVRYLLKKY